MPDSLQPPLLLALTPPPLSSSVPLPFLNKVGSSSRPAMKVTDYYITQNTDEHGEYRANKYGRKLGTAFSRTTPPLAQQLDAKSNLTTILQVLERDGVVVLKNALDKEAVRAFNQEHQKVLARPDISAIMQQQLSERKADLTKGTSAQSFYKG